MFSFLYLSYTFMISNLPELTTIQIINLSFGESFALVEQSIVGFVVSVFDVLNHSDQSAARLVI